ncbi:ACT domain-containing protein ACR1-like [Rutidosis leptorrhynchoides]|uniref:ACT domain-containing protein ACR1-like n=1 Tax=Rutidosis leptorrhynchoides TaxID=125765 RepID=UPI003A9A5D56
MDMGYSSYVNPELESLVDRIHPPRVCIDNDSYQDCTLVKVDSANKHGILLATVQALTDLDLVISKSYICSDGRWFMDVFHVTDQLGNKIIDKNVIHYIQQSICASRRGRTQVKTNSMFKEIKQNHTSSSSSLSSSSSSSMEHMTLEMTTTDRPGLLSEISAVLAELQCHVSAAVVWTHNTRAAFIIHVHDDSNHGTTIMDPHRADRVQAKLLTVVNARHSSSERPSVRFTSPVGEQTHTERRLHQLMMDDKDYQEAVTCSSSLHDKRYEIIVTVENCREKGYSVLNVTSPDRPKLLFDTVCALTDLQYVVFHATVCSKGSVAFQEYYIRNKDGHMLNTTIQREAIIRSIIAAVERRVSHGLRLDVRSRNRSGLLSDVTRVFRENGLSVARAEIGIHGEKAVGSFHVKDVGGHDADPSNVESVKKEIEKFGGAVLVSKGSYNSSSHGNNNTEEDHSRTSLRTLFWSQLERISNKFQSLNS